MFRGWIKMNERCEGCGLPYEPQPGYYLGSVYINCGVTALFVTCGYFGLYFSTDIDRTVLLYSMLAFSVIFPACFFRHARCFWRGLDQLVDPMSLEKDSLDGDETT